MAPLALMVDAGMSFQQFITPQQTGPWDAPFSSAVAAGHIETLTDNLANDFAMAAKKDLYPVRTYTVDGRI